MRDLLLPHETLPEDGFHDLNPQFVRQALLPLLVNKPVDEAAIPPLLDLARHLPAEAPVYRQELLRQAALQALSNVRALTPAQQESLWETAYPSPAILTRTLALLALGRQRPLSERTVSEVERLIRLSPQERVAERRRELARLPEETRRAVTSGPGDAFLLGGVAVGLAAEWLLESNLLPPARRAELLNTLRRAASELNRSLEARLAESSHPLFGPKSSFARSLALSLCDAVRRSPDDDPDWLTRPADIAAVVGQAFSPLLF